MACEYDLSDQFSLSYRVNKNCYRDNHNYDYDNLPAATLHLTIWCFRLALEINIR